VFSHARADGDRRCRFGGYVARRDGADWLHGGAWPDRRGWRQWTVGCWRSL